MHTFIRMSYVHTYNVGRPSLVGKVIRRRNLFFSFCFMVPRVLLELRARGGRFVDNVVYVVFEPSENFIDKES